MACHKSWEMAAGAEFSELDAKDHALSAGRALLSSSLSFLPDDSKSSLAKVALELLLLPVTWVISYLALFHCL